MNPIYTNRYGVSGSHPSFGWTSAVAPYDPPMKHPGHFVAAMRNPAYPKTAAYDPLWVFEMAMGPVSLWLLEDLVNHLALAPGMRVLDLGCGTAATSIFLAREYAVEVWAADLWIDPADNRARILEAGLEEQVHALRAEARSLPFDPSYFDAAVSIDAWHYFGTDVRYLSYFSTFLKPGGQIGVVVPANVLDPDAPGATPPPDLAAQFGADWFTFRSAAWWRRHWSRTPELTVDRAEWAEHGREDWARWVEAHEAHYGPTPDSRLNAGLLELGGGQQFGLCHLIARRDPPHRRPD